MKVPIRFLVFVVLSFLSTTVVHSEVSGTKSALVMLVSMTDAATECGIGEVSGLFFTNSPLSVDSYYDHATWGNVGWTGDVISVSIPFATSPCNADAWADAADAAASAKGYNPNTYTARIYALPSAAGGCGYAFAAGNRVWNFHCSDLFAYGHEVGHTIGLNHASTDHNNDGVVEGEYGGLDDCMGGESYTFNAPHKIWGGWLPRKPSNGGWRVIDSNGSYQISPLEINPATGPPFSQALKIIPPIGDPYFLSYRQPLDFDQGWTASQVGKDGRSGTVFDPVPSISAYPYSMGVTIHRHSGGTGVRTLEVAVLADNQQFAIPGTGIVIRQTGHNANSVALSITGFGGSVAPNGVTFFQNVDYGGAQSQVLSAGNYTLSQLSGRGVANDWASSCRVPAGWTVTMYQHDNFGGTAWALTSDSANLTTLSPNANDQMSSCVIQSGPGIPPSPPTELSAVAGDEQIRLSWTATPGATSYSIKRATALGGPYIPVATNGVSEFTDTGLVNGRPYYYVVSASNGFGTSADSAQVSATPVGDLVAHWKFDETGGAAALDSSGNNNTGTLVNNPTRVAPGKVGPSALAFNAASSQWVTALNSSTLNTPVSAITISAWIYAYDWNGNRRILQKGNSDNQYRLLAENGQLRFHLSGVDTLSAALPPVGTWVHIAGTWNGSTMALYANGVEYASRSAGGTINTTTDPLYIATKNSGAPSGDRFNGRLDDIRIYNRALAAPEIATIMTNSPPTFVANPFNGPSANAGHSYFETVAPNANDPENDPLAFAKLGGPVWLTIASNGDLSGTPLSADAGTNEFLVRATDSSGLFDEATLNVEVIPAPPIMVTIQPRGADLMLSWIGGIAPYEVQTTTNLTDATWQLFENTGGSTNLLLTPGDGAALFRILGQ